MLSKPKYKLSRAEHQLLFLVARRELDAAQRRKFSDLVSEVRDWDYLFTLASSHGLIPLLHHHLHSIDANEAPINFLSRLKRQSVANSQNVLHLFAKQLKLCRLLRENDISAAIFKGSVLAHMAYGEVSLRHAGDIDVLISRADFARTRKSLESLGYQMMPPLTETQLNSHLNSHCEIQFMRDDWFTIVDLHWALAPKSFVFKMNTDEVMSRLQPVNIAGAQLYTFGVEDQVLYQAMHGAKHLWRRLEWISALSELIRSSESIAWDVIIDRAENAHATRMLGLALRLVQRVPRVNIPREVLEVVDKEEVMKRMADQILLQIFTISGAADSTETNLYNLRVMDRKRDALVSALRAIFVPTFTDWSSLYLPSFLHPLYYAYRPLRLSRTYTTLLLQKLTSRDALCL
jgi:hypothetical protein